jgi:integrase
MRGSLVQRYKGSWSIVLDLGYEVDLATGKRKRRQQWVTVRGTKREAEAKLTELLGSANRGDFVKPNRMTFGTWLDEWLEKAIKPPARTSGTYSTYRDVVRLHLKPKLGVIPLQQLRAQDLKRHYTEASQGDAALAPASIALHHVVAHGALKAAALEGLVQKNVATLVVGKPRRQGDRQDVLDHCWESHEAKAFLAAAKAASPQLAAFYALALDSGMRRNELAGLRWSDLDLGRARVKIERQLLRRGGEVTFGPVKNKVPRSIDISSETVAILRHHRGHQAELKLRNGASYRDLGLVFAKEAEHRLRLASAGDPLPVNHLGSEFKRLCEEAGVRPIKLHGLRHTCATLLLQAGIPPHVVQQRLGHRNIAITLGVYAHALPAMQQDAAARLAALLH